MRVDFFTGFNEQLCSHSMERAPNIGETVSLLGVSYVVKHIDSYWTGSALDGGTGWSLQVTLVPCSNEKLARYRSQYSFAG